jgi:hypothetical protein
MMRISGSPSLVRGDTALRSYHYADENALAERHAPIVRIVEQTEDAHGEPSFPTDVDLLTS